MGVRAWLGFAEKPQPAARMVLDAVKARFDALDFADFPWWAQAADTAQGLLVSRDQAMTLPPILRGRNLLCGTISSLPLRTVADQNRPIMSPLLRQIDPNVPNLVTMSQTVDDLFFYGISWWRVFERDFTNFPVSAGHIDRNFVHWQIPSDFPLNRLPSGYYPGSHVFLANTLEAVPARDMIRFDSPHPGLLEHGSRAIRRSLKLQDAADRYADNPQARDYFTSTDDTPPAPGEEEDELNAQVTEMLDGWIASRRLRTTGYVPPGFVHNTVEQMSPVDLQLAELIAKADVGLANLMGLDPEDVGVSTTSRTYSSQLDHRQDLINGFYGPYAKAITDRLSMGDITRRGQSVVAYWNEFLKANPVDRAAVHKVYVDMGAEIDDEVRDDEGRAPLTPEQRAKRTPAPLAPPKPEHSNVVGAPAAPGLATVTSIGSRTAATHQGDAAAVTFSATGPKLMFDLSDVPDRFAVNKLKRTITGLVMPWDRIGRSDGRRWKFAKDSLQYDKSQVNRIVFLEDHVNSAVLGRAVKTWSDDVGQWAVFKVVRGKAGDRALNKAKDGTKSGLSAGVGYQGEDHGLTFGADPNPDGLGPVMYVTAAPWRETSQVAMPAFDDARVSAVAMSADPPNPLEGNPMKCTICGQEHARGIACPTAPALPAAPAAPTYTADQVAAMFAGMTAANAATAVPALPAAPALPALPAAPPIDLDAILEAKVGAAFAKFSADNGGPTFVNPARPGDLAQVNEEPLYRFDGKKAQRCFTADIANQFGGDDELRKKAEIFLADQMAARFANITVGNTTTLNPTINRQDLYVGSLHFTRTIGSMVQGGVVDAITQQKLPKFSSSSGLTATNSEGVEPTDGTFTTTSQTITPAAISGRVTVNREVIDQGGTPQTDQLIWNEMTQFYAELLEKRLVAAFVALGLSDTPIIGTDGDLQAALLSLFAGLQFVAGGDRYRGLALNQDLYTAAVGAKDADGRSLFPMLNPMNAAGSTAPDFSALRIGNKVGLPAWALATGNSGPAKSFLFVPESCYQWFSPPRRIDLDRIAVSTVGIGIWGYSAEFITRTSDVQELAYTPG